MAKVDLINMDGKVVGDFELSDAIFGIEPNQNLVLQAVKAQLANRRQGTSKTKGRSEVRGGGKKPYRQKGTGRARQGSIRAAQWVGGGVIFGPTPRDYSIKLPKKVKRLALKSVLSSKLQNKQVYVVDEITFDAPKTKAFRNLVDNLKLDSTALFVVEEDNRNAKLSARNLVGIETAQYNTINVVDILKYDAFVMTRNAAEKIQEVYA